jgi:hypothetical protein
MVKLKLGEATKISPNLMFVPRKDNQIIQCCRCRAISSTIVVFLAWLLPNIAFVFSYDKTVPDSRGQHFNLDKVSCYTKRSSRHSGREETHDKLREVLRIVIVQDIVQQPM